MWSSTANSLVPAQCCQGCLRDPYLGPAFFSCTLTTCQTHSKATSGCLPRTPSCTLPSQIIQTVKPYNQTLPLSNPGRVNGLWHSILRSVKSIGSQKKEKETVLFDYKLHGITLQLTKNEKYLGIQISDDLAWSKHINQMTTKSNNTLKFIKRNIRKNIYKIKETAYKTDVRPLLEYGIPGKRNTSIK